MQCPFHEPVINEGYSNSGQALLSSQIQGFSFPLFISYMIIYHAVTAKWWLGFVQTNSLFFLKKNKKREKKMSMSRNVVLTCSIHAIMLQYCYPVELAGTGVAKGGTRGANGSPVDRRVKKKKKVFIEATTPHNLPLIMTFSVQKVPFWYTNFQKSPHPSWNANHLCTIKVAGFLIRIA